MPRVLARVAISAVGVLLIGCASRPENVTAQQPPPGRYEAFDCERLMRDGDAASNGVKSLSESLNRGVPVSFLFFEGSFPLFQLPRVGGKSEAQALGKLKGELETINRLWLEKGCGRGVPHAADESPLALPIGSEPGP